MHKHHIAHLDISIRNLLTDFNGHYAYIDFELSRRFEGLPTERVYSDGRGTEIPPECEDGNIHDPYKVDVWALAVLMLRACKVLRVLLSCCDNSDLCDKVDRISPSRAAGNYQTHAQ